MRRVHMRSGLLVLSLATLCTPLVASAQVTVTYVANEGFLLAASEGKVLIDALLDAGLRWYARPPDEMRPALEQALPPFDRVDLLLATHHHDDHFGPRATARHLQSNARARFISTPQAVARLDDTLEKSVVRRIEALFPKEGARIHRQVGEIHLQLLNLHHGRGRNPPVENLGFLLQLGGLLLLHIGDTEANRADFAVYSLAQESIDVAFLPAWYLTSSEWIEVVRAEIRPVRIVVMHLALPGAPASYFGRDGSYRERLTTIRANFPEAVIFENAGESVTFPFASEESEAAPAPDNGR
ncbi:MAG: MBL fold metallo-hydrolase [Candidatus Latescibacterota bacterium]|nr:MAG: MBL fold metallo-hydrolase [Candidatus Latescibacterota bacterium]